MVCNIIKIDLHTKLNRYLENNARKVLIKIVIGSDTPSIVRV